MPALFELITHKYPQYLIKLDLNCMRDSYHKTRFTREASARKEWRGYQLAYAVYASLICKLGDWLKNNIKNFID